MTTPVDGGQDLDASFLRVAGSLDGGRIRHPGLAGRLIVAARLAQGLLARDDDRPERVDRVSSSPTDAEEERRRHLQDALRQGGSALADVTAALVASGVWQPAPGWADRLLRRPRHRDTDPSATQAVARALTTGRRALDASAAVLQELVHSYAPSSSTLTWWTTDPHFPVGVVGLDATTVQRLGELFETARAAGPGYTESAAAAAQAGWQPTATTL